jgi:hypothetical protein
VASTIDMSGARRNPASSGRHTATSATRATPLPTGYRPSHTGVQLSPRQSLWPEDGDGPGLGPTAHPVSPAGRPVTSACMVAGRLGHTLVAKDRVSVFRLIASRRATPTFDRQRRWGTWVIRCLRRWRRAASSGRAFLPPWRSTAYRVPCHGLGSSRGPLAPRPSSAVPERYRSCLTQIVNVCHQAAAGPAAARTAPSLLQAPRVVAASGPVIGNRRSHVYHRPDCPNYADVASRNRVPFGSATEAESAGYRLARNCP